MLAAEQLDSRTQGWKAFNPIGGVQIMATSVLEQYNIAQFIEWHDTGQLLLNPDFQRRSVWSPGAKASLVDTILRRLPIPKIYLRTKINLTTKKSFREVVDGQQRLRAIIEYAQDKFALSKRAGEFAGLKYSDLDSDQKQAFLSYPIAVDQLINATDSDVLEVFSRLNSYTVSLNAAEKRHGKYSGAFRWAVHNTSKAWGEQLWDAFGVVTKRQRLRMQDDALTAEMYSIMLKGIMDGGEANIDKVYKEFDKTFVDEDAVTERVNACIGFVVENLQDVLEGGMIAKGPHFLMLFAACAHGLHGLPPGAMLDRMPERDQGELSDADMVKGNLSFINDILDSDEPPSTFRNFWMASKSSTHRISSRKIRFPVYYQALLPEPLDK